MKGGTQRVQIAAQAGAWRERGQAESDRLRLESERRFASAREALGARGHCLFQIETKVMLSVTAAPGKGPSTVFIGRGSTWEQALADAAEQAVEAS